MCRQGQVCLVAVLLIVVTALLLWPLRLERCRPLPAKGEEVPRGSFVTIRDKAASWLRLPPNRFRRILKKLIDWNVLAVKTVNNRYTLISVVDCEPYLEPEK